MKPEIASLDRLVADLYAEYYAEGDHPAFLPSQSSIESMTSRLGAVSRRATPCAIGLFWSNHFADLVKALEYAVAEDQEKAFRYIDRLTSALRGSLAPDQPDRRGSLKRAEVKFGTAVETLTQVARLSYACSRADANQVDHSTQLLRGQLGLVRGLGNEFFSTSLADRMEEALSGVSEAARSSSHARTAAKRDCSDTISRAFAWDVNEVLSWYKDDLKLCEDELYSIARRIDPRRTPFQILDQDLGPCSSPEEMFISTKHYVASARKRSLDYITLPDDELLVVGPMAPAFKVTCPWGVYDKGAMAPDHLVGHLELNEDNYKAVTKGWLEMMAVHEGYPGHHSHFVKTKSSAIPASFKTSTTAADYLIEGIAHRSERLLEDLFPERAYPLFVAYRRLHCTVRIKAEVDLHLCGRPTGGTVEEYMRVMQFDKPSAEVQTQAHLIQPGRAFSYYTGMRVLEAGRKRLGLDPKRFTEIVFSHGNVSLRTMLAIAGLDEEGRKKVLDLDDPGLTE